MAAPQDRPDVHYLAGDSPEELACMRDLAKLPLWEQLRLVEEMGRMRRFSREGPSATEAWPEPTVVVENRMPMTARDCEA